MGLQPHTGTNPVHRRDAAHPGVPELPPAFCHPLTPPHYLHGGFQLGAVSQTPGQAAPAMR